MNAVMRYVAVGAGLLSISLAACSPPKGKDNGRVEVTNTTPAERGDAQVQPPAQHEFSSLVAQQLAADLSHVSALNGEFRSTVVFGDIVNKTQVVPTSDFEAFRTRIRSELMQSQMVLKNIRFVENKARIDELNRREGGTEGRAALNPKYTFYLNGEMYRTHRTDNGKEINEYHMSYNLTSMESGELVWANNPYDVKQVR